MKVTTEMFRQHYKSNHCNIAIVLARYLIILLCFCNKNEKLLHTFLKDTILICKQFCNALV